MLPKKKIKINPYFERIKPGTEYLKYGLDRIEELMRATNKKSTYLPRSIKLEDIDIEVKNFIDEGDELKLVLDDQKVPVFYLENDRWGEFSKTWKYMDNDKNVPTPYITLRRILKEPGTRLGGRWTVAQRKRFRYLDVPILDEGQIINLRFKVPQPINVDLTYEVRLFTKYREDVNVYDTIFLKTFASRQAYINVKGNYMPVILENMEEANTIENIDGDRYYSAIYRIRAMAFLQDEEEFEIVKTSRLPRIGYDLH